MKRKILSLTLALLMVAALLPAAALAAETTTIEGEITSVEIQGAVLGTSEDQPEDVYVDQVYLVPVGTVVLRGENGACLTGLYHADKTQITGDWKTAYKTAMGAEFDDFETPAPFTVIDDSYYVIGSYNTACEVVLKGVGEPMVKVSKPLAYASTQTVNVDGKAVEFQMYALKDGNGNMTNYVKARDVASVLNGTAAQFDVTWDAEFECVDLRSGKGYVPNGSEMSTPYSGDRDYERAGYDFNTKVDGEPMFDELEAIILTDDNGGGYTYYKLRDLGEQLGFNVGWSADKGVFVETDKPYVSAD